MTLTTVLLILVVILALLVVLLVHSHVRALAQIPAHTRAVAETVAAAFRERQVIVHVHPQPPIGAEPTVVLKGKPQLIDGDATSREAVSAAIRDLSGLTRRPAQDSQPPEAAVPAPAAAPAPEPPPAAGEMGAVG